jgi:hypothetical protein
MESATVMARARCSVEGVAHRGGAGDLVGRGRAERGGRDEDALAQRVDPGRLCCLDGFGQRCEAGVDIGAHGLGLGDATDEREILVRLDRGDARLAARSDRAGCGVRVFQRLGHGVRGGS